MPASSLHCLAGCRTVLSLLRAARFAVSRRPFHGSALCRALPVPSAVEAAASKWVQSRVNPNGCSDLSNLPLSLALLKVAHRVERGNAAASHSANIVINPVSVALQLRDSQRAQQALRSALSDGVSSEQLQSLLSGVDHTRIARELSAANGEFAQWRLAATSTVSSSVASRPSSSSFSGFLAPRFALTKTVSPSWFIPTATAAQQSAFEGSAAAHSVLPYRPDDTAVTALERSIRVPARMMYRTGKLWYVEGVRHQMADVPYLHPHYSLTLLCARFTDEPSIDEHPQPTYSNLRRERADIHSLLEQLSPQQLVHDMRYMTLLPGLLVLPTFDAHYRLQLGGDSGLSDSSRLVMSGAGLQSGGLKTLSHRPSRPFPHFLLSAHRPFIFLIRHRPTNHVALIGLVEQVERDPTEYTYKERKVQWLEDRAPIQQF